MGLLPAVATDSDCPPRRGPGNAGSEGCVRPSLVVSMKQEPPSLSISVSHTLITWCQRTPFQDRKCSYHENRRMIDEATQHAADAEYAPGISRLERWTTSPPGPFGRLFHNTRRCLLIVFDLQW
jgi:hypothetical protein